MTKPKLEQPYKCIFCGAPSWLEPNEQTMPPDYCREEDHGTPEDYEDYEDYEVGAE